MSIRLALASTFTAMVVAAGVGNAQETERSLQPSPGEVMKELDTEIDKFQRLRNPPKDLTNTEEVFDFFDDNGDGVIDSSEWNTRKMLLFTARDKNDDGKLSPSELPGLGPEAFAEADTNGDGFLDGLEFNQAPFMQFDQVRTQPGPIDRAEFDRIMARLSH